MRMRQIICPCWPSLNKCVIIGYFTIFLFVNTICNVITVNIFLICWHMEGLLHPGGPVITWLSVGREQTDELNLSMTGWPVWLGDLYDWATSMTCMTRWLLSPDDLYHWATSILVWLGNLYDLHDQATSITGWLLWPACPSDIYHWVTSMTMWPVWPPWLDDLYDQVTSMTWRPPWPDDFYDCVGRPPGEGWLLFSRAHFPPTSTVHWYITIVWHSCANIPSN